MNFRFCFDLMFGDVNYKSHDFLPAEIWNAMQKWVLETNWRITAFGREFKLETVRRRKAHFLSL